MRFGLPMLLASALTLPVAILARGADTAPMVVGDQLKPVGAFADIRDPARRSQALFTEMGKVIQSPRCMNCHPRTDRPTQTDAFVPHEPAVTRGPEGQGAPGLECATCHGPANVVFANGRGSIPGNPNWHLAPIEMAWQGKTLGEICRQIKNPARNGHKTLADLVEHHGKDKLVGWAWHPGVGRKPAPGTQEEFGALTQAWIETGARCPPS